MLKTTKQQFFSSFRVFFYLFDALIPKFLSLASDSTRTVQYPQNTIIL